MMYSILSRSKQLSSSLILVALLASGCNKSSQVDDTVLARVDQDYLYLSDIRHILPEELKGEDSTNFVESYVQKWVHEKLLYEKASANLSDNQGDIENEVEKYKQALFVYKYEQKLIAQKLDKNISTEEISKYYNTHKAEFILDENIIKPLLIQVSHKIGDISKVMPLLNSRDESDMDKIKDFCYQNSTKFYFAEDWFSEYEISSLLPSKRKDMKSLYFTKQVLQERDSLFYYFVRVDELLAKGELAPIEYVEADIKQIILQKRTQELVKGIRNKIFGDALKKNLYEIYNK